MTKTLVLDGFIDLRCTNFTAGYNDANGFNGFAGSKYFLIHHAPITEEDEEDEGDTR